MLRAIEIENFKAFGERNRIELAPITLIFGENSAGKSSILQALNLLKQTRQNREHGALLLPRSESGIVELGGFQELLFDHDLARELSFRIDLAPRQSSRRRSSEALLNQPVDDEYQGIEATFGRSAEDTEIQLRRLKLYTSASSGLAAEFTPTTIEASRFRPIVVHDPLAMTRPYRATAPVDMQAARCTWLTADREFWADIYTRSKRRAEKIVDELRQLRTDANESFGRGSLFEDVESERRTWLTEIDESIAFYESDFTIEVFINRMLQAELQALIGLDGFIPVGLRQNQRETLPELETFRRYGPSRLRMRDLTLDVGGFAVDCGRLLDDALANLYPMGPFRRGPQRWYIYTGSNPRDVGYSGDLLPDLLYRRPELVDETNNWLAKLEIGYQIKVQTVGTRSQDLFEVRLVDKRRGREVDVALSDVGFGVSQVLPFIVQSLASERQTITIEQPEVHIHPRLQADIGDLLAATIQPPRLHRFIIETHSEHLVLRMQRLVREGKLKPEDVSIIYVTRGINGSSSQRLRLDKSGDFVDDWPGGFFPERLRELL